MYGTPAQSTTGALNATSNSRSVQVVPGSMGFPSKSGRIAISMTGSASVRANQSATEKRLGQTTPESTETSQE
jgi:hypothetical protein